MISKKSNILNLNSNNQTMNLKDITDLLSVEHNKAMKTVLIMCKDVSFGAVEETTSVYNNNGQSVKTYKLNKRQSIAVASRLNVSLLMVIIDRWQELENTQPVQALPTNFIEALECLVTSEKEKAVALQVIEDQKPAMLVYDRLADRKTDISTTVLAKHLGITANKLNKFLRNEGIKFVKRDLPTAKYAEWFNIVSDCKNGHDYSQCLVTDLGFIEITKLWSEQC